MINKFEFVDKVVQPEQVSKVDFIIEACRNKTVLDLGCIRHSAEFALSDPNWLHKHIKAAAKEVVGVDFLADEADKLKKHGYDIVVGDVTKKLNLEKKFDVIVAGDLIEHLVNFDGFFSNCFECLLDDGVLIITTPNPFFSDEYYYVAFRNMYFINPEHTCWIDPLALAQLADRCGFYVKKIYFLKSSWQLPFFFLETAKTSFDCINSRWLNDNLKMRLLRRFARILGQIIFPPWKFITGGRRPLVKHSDYLGVLRKHPQ